LSAAFLGTNSLNSAPGGSAEGAPVSPAVARSVVPPPTRLAFDGRTWTIKSSTGPIGPGPNLFDPSGPYIDQYGDLNLRIMKMKAGWESSEVILNPSLGYGTYVWTIRGPLSTIDQNAVLALFTFDSAKPVPWNREIDFEASRFGTADNTTNAQYVVQPYYLTGNLQRIFIPTATITKVSMTWKPGSVTYTGETVGPTTTKPLPPWKNTSSSVPVHGAEQIHMSLWLFQGVPPSNGLPVTVTISSFAFRPAT
jgi:hypothetical protein